MSKPSKPALSSGLGCQPRLWPVAALLLASGSSAHAGNFIVDLNRSLWGTMERGGSVMWPILGLSVVGLALLLEVAVRTRKKNILPDAGVQALQGSTDKRAAVALLLQQDSRCCLHRVLAIGQRWRHGTTVQIQAAIEEAVDDMRWQLRRSVRALGIIANTAPLLGLLGTVLGITQCFDVVSKQGALGDPSALAGGISEALLTTCFGLIVAIPMLLCHHYYLGKIDTLMKQCEELAKEALILPPDDPAAAPPAGAQPIPAPVPPPKP